MDRAMNTNSRESQQADLAARETGRWEAMEQRLGSIQGRSRSRRNADSRWGGPYCIADHLAK